MDQKDMIVWMDRLIRGSFYVLILCLPVSIALVESFSGFAIFFLALKRALVFAKAGQAGVGLWRRVRDFFAPPTSFLDRPFRCF